MPSSFRALLLPMPMRTPETRFPAQPRPAPSAPTCSRISLPLPLPAPAAARIGVGGLSVSSSFSVGLLGFSGSVARLRRAASTAYSRKRVGLRGRCDTVAVPLGLMLYLLTPKCRLRSCILLLRAFPLLCLPFRAGMPFPPTAALYRVAAPAWPPSCAPGRQRPRFGWPPWSGGCARPRCWRCRSRLVMEAELGVVDEAMCRRMDIRRCTRYHDCKLQCLLLALYTCQSLLMFFPSRQPVANPLDALQACPSSQPSSQPPSLCPHLQSLSALTACE